MVEGDAVVRGRGGGGVVGLGVGRSALRPYEGIGATYFGVATARGMGSSRSNRVRRGVMVLLTPFQVASRETEAPALTNRVILNPAKDLPC